MIFLSAFLLAVGIALAVQDKIGAAILVLLANAFITYLAGVWAGLDEADRARDGRIARRLMRRRRR
jgi:hypothetical protein